MSNLNQLKAEDFLEWQSHPVTEIFLKYLKDSAEEESSALAVSILNGAVYSEKEQTHVATLCVALTNIAEIEYAEIEDFYHKGD